MNLDVLVGILVAAAICALLAFLASLLLKGRHTVLAYLGAGLLGQAIGGWIGAAVHGTGWPVAVTLAGATVHLLWTFVGALIVLLVARLIATR